jgi:excinuclease UvrABC ATPase subunit
MYKIAYSKNYKPGRCELCGKNVEHLERHHIKYSPEITIDLCHDCHFTCHYFPERLQEEYKIKLLMNIMTIEKAREFLSHYSRSRVKLAVTFAPSRRESIINSQKGC